MIANNRLLVFDLHSNTREKLPNPADLRISKSSNVTSRGEVKDDTMILVAHNESLLTCLGDDEDDAVDGEVMSIGGGLDTCPTAAGDVDVMI